MEYYLATKRNQVIMHATTCVNLENRMLNDKSQSPKTTHCMVPFMEKVQNRQRYIQKVD
jgi:hypothetical protein